MVKPSEGDNVIKNGMKLHVTRVTEWKCPEWDDPDESFIKPYAEELLWHMQSVRDAQSALVTRHWTRPARWYKYHTSPEIDLDWELYSIVIQSPLLRRVVESIFRYYSGDMPRRSRISTSPEHVELIAPFKPYLKERLEDALRKEQDPETKQHLSLLCNVLQGKSSNTEKIKENAAVGMVFFEDLPLMFKPGAILFTMIEGQPQLVSLREWYHSTNDKDRRFMHLECTYLDWRGTRFGSDDVRTDLFLFEFEGPQRITDLPLFPLIFHPSRLEVENMLISRGKIFEAHKGYHYCAYTGIGVDNVDTIGREEHQLHDATYVQGRVIIDTAAFYKLHPNPMQRSKCFDKFDLDLHDGDEMQLHLDGAAEILSREQLRLCAPTLRAYSVDDKKWLHIMVDNVRGIEWDDQAFKNLAQPQEMKEMILAFADSQIRHKQDTKNGVRGKNNGVIVVCGPPGAGKKLTAGAIAEELHAPLYTLSAGDLGKTPEEVELFLTTTLEFAAKWKAVLILDDATAFVKTRSTHDGQRNDLVPIYQRILEHYDSVLFLNTNLSGDIDNAFESRVYLSSGYHGPDMASTQPERRTQGDFEKLAQTPKTYGRVGDVFKEAQLLAKKQKIRMSLEHVKTVTQSRAADAIRNRSAE